MMKTLIQKELRENLKLALPGLLIFSFLLLISYMNAETQPLLKNNTLGIVELFCNMFGLALGWFQISHERHRDLWAFLIHRPLTRTQVFFCKGSRRFWSVLPHGGLAVAGVGCSLSDPRTFRFAI